MINTSRYVTMVRLLAQYQLNWMPFPEWTRKTFKKMCYRKIRKIFMVKSENISSFKYRSLEIFQ